MPLSPAPRLEFRNFRWILFCLVFWGIPALLLIFEVQLGNLEWQRKERLRKIPHLEKIISRFEARGAPLSYLRGPLERAAFYLERVPDLAFGWKKVQRQLERHFPGMTETVFLNPEGEPLPGFSGPLPDRAWGGDFFRDYISLCRREGKSFTRNLARYRRFLGPLVARNDTDRLVNHIDSASYRAEHSFVYFSPIIRWGMFLVFLNQTPDFEYRIRRHQVLSLQKVRPRLKMMLIRLEEDADFQEARTYFREPRIPAILARLGTSKGKTIAANGKLWTQYNFNQKLRTLIAIPDETVAVIADRNLRVRMACGLVFIILSIWVRPFFLWGRVLTLSIQAKLVLLLAYVVGIPLALIGVASQGFLAERKTVLEDNLHTSQLKILREVDRRFQKHIGDLSRHLQKILQGPSQAKGPLFQTLREQMEGVSRTLSPALCELLDEEGRSVYHPKTSWGENAQKFLAGIQKGVAQLFRDLNDLPEKQDTQVKDQIINMTAEFLGFNPDLIFSAFCQSLGTLREFQLASERYHGMLLPVRDDRRVARFMVLVTWKSSWLAKQYIKVAPTVDLPTFGETFLSFSEETSQPGIEALLPLSRISRALVPSITHQKLPIRARFLARNGRIFYITGMKGNLLQKQFLVAATSDEGILRNLREWSIRFLLLSIGICLISFLAGSSLSRTFLRPVAHLTAGIVALDQRRFQTHIPVGDEDEFGELASTFNQMMDGLADLEIAKVVQDHFFPPGPLSQNGWEVAGSCVSASRVGGDYFDYFPLDNHRFLVMIGDVSGHGVGAALVVAMVKAVMSHPENSYEPAATLGILQTIFLGTLQRKKMMSCSIGIFDSEQGRLTISNAGHAYPFLVRNEKAEQIVIPGVLLGMKSKRGLATVEVSLNPKDCLIFYTDGFVEAVSPNGIMLGYELVETELPELVRDSAPATGLALRDWHTRKTRPGPPDDDTTLVVLQRKETGPNVVNRFPNDHEL